MWRAVKKHGVENFTFEVMASGTDSEMLGLERVKIAELQTQGRAGYNLTGGGEGQFHPSDEVRKKLASKSRANMAQPHRRFQLREFNGVQYVSMKEAMQSLGVCYATVRRVIHNGTKTYAPCDYTERGRQLGLSRRGHQPTLETRARMRDSHRGARSVRAKRGFR